MTPEQAVSVIHNGDRVVFGHAGGRADHLPAHDGAHGGAVS